MTREQFEASTPEFAKRARLEACGLIRLGRFRPDEREDLEQEFLLQVWRKRERLDSAHKGSSTYLAATMRNKGRDLIRYEYAPVRDRRRQSPIPDDLDAEERRAAPPALVVQPELDDPIDVRRAVSRLPAQKQRFVSLLADRGVTEAADELGISRSTAWRWVREAKGLLRRRGWGPTSRSAAGGRGT